MAWLDDVLGLVSAVAPAAIRAGTDRPYNLNFFCHRPPEPDAAREAAWRATLAPFYREHAIDPAAIPAGPGRTPFSAELAGLIEAFRPPVVSFHFGLPAPDLLARVKGWGAKVLSSATTVAEARWLQAHGADAVIAQVGHKATDQPLDPRPQSVALAVLLALLVFLVVVDVHAQRPLAQDAVLGAPEIPVPAHEQPALAEGLQHAGI